MRRMVTLYRPSVGKKVVMAVSGLLLYGFVYLHMLGNLKAFQPRTEPEAYFPLDVYGTTLRELGYPLVPEYGLLWIARIVLLVAVGFHVFAAFQLWSQSREARRVGYRKEQSQVFSYASRTMRWGGIIILLFVVYHILHFTTGTVHPEFEYGAVQANLVIGLRSWPVAGFYILAVGALSLHVYHGFWSLFTTLGVENPRVERMRRPLALVLALALFIGYVAVPVGVLAGLVTVH